MRGLKLAAAAFTALRDAGHIFYQSRREVGTSEGHLFTSICPQSEYVFLAHPTTVFLV